jgi:4-hydroxyacetophenone monooxygenase
MGKIETQAGGAAPIVEDDAAIAAALQSAQVPSLTMALVHLSGDPEMMKPDWRPTFELGGDGQGQLPPEVQAAIRAKALEVLAAYRDRGCTLPPPPSPETVRRMMGFIAGTAIPEHYVPFLLSELSLDRAPEPEAPQIDRHGGFHVVVIGAGMSGLLAGIELDRAGIPFTIIEKDEDVGGTWLENTYPGCRVDNPNHIYSYSFEPNPDWPQHFSTRDVLWNYFRGVADKYRLRDRIRFKTTVRAAAFDEAAQRWRVTAVSESGEVEVIEANAVISAVGQLNRPKLPDIAGIDRFAGPSFHSARWRHDVDLTGKRVAVIGTGASAFQIVPEIASRVASLAVFQRTPPWLGPTPDYFADVTPGKKWLLKHVPFYAKWYRFALFWQLTDGLYPMVKADPAWNGPPNAVSQANEMLRQLLAYHIARQLPDNPALRAKATPDYPPCGKRMVRDNGVWLAALARDNVELVTDPVGAITETGIVTADGRARPVDVIVYATGFEASHFLEPMQIAGRGGLDLHRHWAGDPRAYLGMTIPGFPNLFCIYGPNTNLVVNGSIVFFSECAMHYIMGCLRLLTERGAQSMECRRDVHDAFNADVDKTNLGMAWGAPHVSSWYKGENGRVTQNWPYPLVDYWHATRAPDPEDFLWR